MGAVQVTKTPTQFILTFDRSQVDEERLLRWLDLLRLEYLVRKADFGPEIEAAGEEALASWWEKNKSRLIPAAEQ